MIQPIVIVTFIASVLVGCAYAPTAKQELTEAGYETIAKRWTLFTKCSEVGHMDPATAALGLRYLRADLYEYAFSEDTLIKATAAQQHFEPVKADCNIAAIGVLGRKQQIDINNAAVDQRRAETQRILESTRSKQTQCTRIGTQVFCNTF